MFVTADMSITVREGVHSGKSKALAVNLLSPFIIFPLYVTRYAYLIIPEVVTVLICCEVYKFGSFLILT